MIRWRPDKDMVDRARCGRCRGCRSRRQAPSLPSPAGGGGLGWGVVGHPDGLVFALEAVERGDRAKGLLPGDDHVGRHIGQHRRLEEAAAQPLC